MHKRENLPGWGLWLVGLPAFPTWSSISPLASFCSHSTPSSAWYTHGFIWQLNDPCKEPFTPGPAGFLPLLQPQFYPYPWLKGSSQGHIPGPKGRNEQHPQTWRHLILECFLLWVPGVVAIKHNYINTWAFRLNLNLENVLLLKTFPDPMPLGGFEISSLGKLSALHYEAPSGPTAGLGKWISDHPTKWWCSCGRCWRDRAAACNLNLTHSLLFRGKTWALSICHGFLCSPRPPSYRR